MKISRANHQRIEQKIRVGEAALNHVLSSLRGLFLELHAVEGDPPTPSALEQARLEGWLAAIQALSESEAFTAHEDVRAAIIGDIEQRCERYFGSVKVATLEG